MEETDLHLKLDARENCSSQRSYEEEPGSGVHLAPAVASSPNGSHIGSNSPLSSTRNAPRPHADPNGGLSRKRDGQYDQEGNPPDRKRCKENRNNVSLPATECEPAMSSNERFTTEPAMPRKNSAKKPFKLQQQDGPSANHQPIELESPEYQRTSPPVISESDRLIAECCLEGVESKENIEILLKTNPERLRKAARYALGKALDQENPEIDSDDLPDAVPDDFQLVVCPQIYADPKER